MRKKIVLGAIILVMTASLIFASTSAFDIQWWNQATYSNLPSNTLKQWAEDMEGRAGINVGTGHIYYVDSGVTNESDGSSWTNARNTLDEAINLCTANNGDLIYLAPGHAETLSAADGWDADVAGVTIIGLGNGSDRPTFTYSATGSTAAIGAAGVSIYNLRFVAGISAVAVGLSVEAGGDYFVMSGCEFVNPASAALEFVSMVSLAEAADYVTIDKNKMISLVSSTGCVNAITISAGVVNRLTITNNEIQGNFITTGAIYSNQVNTNALIANNIVRNTATTIPAINFSAATTGFAIGNVMYSNTFGTAGVTIFDPGSMSCIENYAINTTDLSATLVPPDPAISVVSRTAGSMADILAKLYYTTDGTDVYPATVANDSTIAKILSSAEPPAASSYNNTTMSLQALNVDLDAILAKTGLTYTGNNTAASTTTPVVANLIGYGNDYFNTDWVMICILNADGIGTAPEGDVRDITDYVSSSGTFTVTQFSAALASGDQVMVARREVFAIEKASLNAVPVAGSLAAYIAGGTVGTGTVLPASTSLYDVVSKLSTIADGTDVFTTVTADSILAKIMCTGATATANTYNNTTDSLEAISNMLWSTDGVLAWPTAAAYANNISIAEVLGYIQDGVRKGTGTAMDTNKSVADTLGTNGTTLVDDAVSIAGIIGIPTDADNAVASTTIVANGDGSLYERLEYLQDMSEKCVIKSQTTIATANLFAVAGGPIEVQAIVGVVTNTIQTQADSIKLLVDPTAPDTDTDLCAAVEINADAIGTVYTITGTFANAMIPTTAGVVATTATKFIVPIGMIELNGTASNTGTIVWYLTYKPLAPGVTVVAQ